MTQARASLLPVCALVDGRAQRAAQPVPRGKAVAGVRQQMRRL